jgi:hypothetical protein
MMNTQLFVKGAHHGRPHQRDETPLNGYISAARPRGHRGWSLAEMTMGILIMMIALVPALRVIMNETAVVSGTREHAQAASIAQRLIETGRSFPFEKLDRFVRENQNTVVRVQDIEYHVTDVLVENIMTSDPPGKVCARRLSFCVQYQSTEGRRLKLDLATVVARHD